MDRTGATGLIPVCSDITINASAAPPEAIWRTPVTSHLIMRRNFHYSLTSVATKPSTKLHLPKMWVIISGSSTGSRVLAGRRLLGLQWCQETVIMRVKYTPLITHTKIARNCKVEQCVSYGECNLTGIGRLLRGLSAAQSATETRAWTDKQPSPFPVRGGVTAATN